MSYNMEPDTMDHAAIILLTQQVIQIRIIIIITITNKEYKANQKSICVRMRKGENGEGT